MARRQGVYWLLTIPRPDWDPCLPEGVSYCTGQAERGGETGYEHWQVLAIFANKVSLHGVKRVFGQSVHAELSRSQAADEYVHKEDTRVAGNEFA